MIKLEELYDKAKLPVDMALLDSLLEKYKSIPIHELNYSEQQNKNFEFANGYSRLSSLLYDQINSSKQTTKTTEKFRQDYEKLLRELNQDFALKGNYDPKAHGGTTNPLRVLTGWETFKSWNLLGTDRIHSAEQLHRFYIGITNDNKYDFAYELYNEFKRANIPFYFKVETSSENRTDKVVIYTSTSLLAQTMTVLGNIESKRNDLMKSCITPSIIVGKVTDKIGYASEFPSSGISYTQLICENLANAINSLMNEYIKGSIKESVKRIYDKKVEELESRGYFLEHGEKMKIAFEVLIEHDPDFKVKLLDIFKANLTKAGIDIDNICFSKKAKMSIDEQHNPLKNKKIDIFDPKVLNQVITLPNGNVMTIDEYLKRNRIWSLIPLNATVTLNTLGISMSGTKFIENVIKRTNQFNDIEEFFKVYGVRVDRKNHMKSEEIIIQNYEENNHMSR